MLGWLIRGTASICASPPSRQPPAALAVDNAAADHDLIQQAPAALETVSTPARSQQGPHQIEQIGIPAIQHPLAIIDRQGIFLQRAVEGLIVEISQGYDRHLTAMLFVDSVQPIGEGFARCHAVGLGFVLALRAGRPVVADHHQEFAVNIEIHLKEFTGGIALDDPVLKGAPRRYRGDLRVVEKGDIDAPVIAGVRMGHRVLAPPIGLDLVDQCAQHGLVLHFAHRQDVGATAAIQGADHLGQLFELGP